jgi:hypothetical protein
MVIKYFNIKDDGLLSTIVFMCMLLAAAEIIILVGWLIAKLLAFLFSIVDKYHIEIPKGLKKLTSKSFKSLSKKVLKSWGIIWDWVDDAYHKVCKSVEWRD